MSRGFYRLSARVDGFSPTVFLLGFTSSRVTLLPGQPNSLFDADGSSLVVHASYDDYNSQPDGASAERVACGVIEPL